VKDKVFTRAGPRPNTLFTEPMFHPTTKYRTVMNRIAIVSHNTWIAVRHYMYVACI